MADTECLGGHSFIMVDEMFSNATSPWRMRCDCAQRQLVIEFDRRSRVWRFKVPVSAAPSIPGEAA